jgi:hypothetical protein
MVPRLPRVALGALLAVGLAAAPAQAAQHQSSRIDVKLRAAGRALDRASASDDSAATVSALATVRRNLAAASKTALRKPTSETFEQLAAVEDDIVGGTVALYDGQTGDTVTALSTTLKNALDARDALVTAVNALTDKTDYAGVLDAIHEDATDEAADIADTVTDDELTAEAKTALDAATTQLTATAAAAPAATDGDDSDYPGAGTDADGRDCPAHGSGQRAGGDYPGQASGRGRRN